MGRISQKLVATFRGPVPPTDQEMQESVRLFAMGLFDGAPMLEPLLEEGYDPLHIKYILGHQFALMFSDAMREYAEFHEYFDIAAEVAASNARDPDETTPVTGSYLSLWTLFDLQFGRDLETIGTCLTDVLQAMQAEPHVVQLIRHLSESRMGFYQHQGADGSHILLRELVTGRELRCPFGVGLSWSVGGVVVRTPGSSAGCEPHLLCHTHHSLCADRHERRRLDGLLEQVAVERGADEPRNLHELLKFGKRPMAWHDFIVRAYLCGRPRRVSGRTAGCACQSA